MSGAFDGPSAADIAIYGARRAMFERAGFSRRAVGVLCACDVPSLAALVAEPWDDPPEGIGLARALLRTPNCGQKVLNEIRRFRETGSPARTGLEPVTVAATLQPDEAQALDAWRTSQADSPSRGEALRRLVLAALAPAAAIGE